MFTWTEKSELAAQLLAGGRLSIVEIAKRCEVDPKTVWRWKKDADFQTRIQEHLAAIRKRFASEGFAVKENRIAAKRRRIGAIMRGLRARAGNPARGGAEWDDSGLFVQREKSLNIGQGIYEPIIEFELDTGALAALDNLEREIGIEVGDYKTKVVHSEEDSGTNDRARQIALAMTTDEICSLIERLNGERPMPDPPAGAGVAADPGRPAEPDPQG